MYRQKNMMTFFEDPFYNVEKLMKAVIKEEEEIALILLWVGRKVWIIWRRREEDNYEKLNHR